MANDDQMYDTNLFGDDMPDDNRDDSAGMIEDDDTAV